MDSVQAFLHMGGYGGYVWPAFGITLLVLAGLLIASLRSLKTRESALETLQVGGIRARPAEGSDEA